MDNMVKLKEHGYKVQINYSLGSYNKDHWDQVLRFAVSNGLDLKAIALIRSDENPNFYGGDWVDPSWVAQRIHLQVRTTSPLVAVRSVHEISLSLPDLFTYINSLWWDM